jgi:hypothetical protein
MMLEISVEDIHQMYVSSVVMHKNKPVFIKNVAGDGEIRFLDLLSQEEQFAPFSLKDFITPNRRIGMVNINGGVAWISRNPVRKFKVGYCRENTYTTIPDNAHFPNGNGRADARDMARRLHIKEVGDAIMGKYPTLKQAISRVDKYQGCIAFDKQFALNADRRVIYRTRAVGFLPYGETTVDGIRWDAKQEHLIQLLEKNYEKTARTIRG